MATVVGHMLYLVGDVLRVGMSSLAFALSTAYPPRLHAAIGGIDIGAISSGTVPSQAVLLAAYRGPNPAAERDVELGLNKLQLAVN
jgi:hypothetical protein